MDIREYANKVAEQIGNGAKAQEVTKTNGVIKTGIVINQGTVSPTVYIDDMYKDGYSVEKAAATVMEVAEKSRVDNGFDPGMYADYEGFVKANLRARLYNKATKAEVKRSAAARGFKDLIIVPYVEIDVAGIKGGAKVTKQHVDLWGVTEKEVIDTALENTSKDVIVKDLMGYVAHLGLGGLNELDLPDMIDGPVIVTNNETQYGASAVLGLLPTFKKKYRNGFFVIPSSIHETLVIPNTGVEDLDSLTEMVKEVNATILPEEVLADMAYAFGV